MTPEQFTYWLQGYFEISDPKKLTEKEITVIKDHLKLVFTKVTPTVTEFGSFPSPNPYVPQPFQPINPNPIYCEEGLDKPLC